jgi:broad specificity phosphatase PhoE
MARVWLVRHAEPAEAIGIDPDLTERGVEQAAALVSQLEPSALLTSPLRRARSTAQPLAEAWATEAIVEPAVRELPSPTSTIEERQAWLRTAMRRDFADLGDDVIAWRRGIGGLVASRRVDTVIVTHAIVINAVVGMCTGDARVLHVRPAHAAVTVIDVDADGRLALVSGGRESETFIG